MGRLLARIGYRLSSMVWAFCGLYTGPDATRDVSFRSPSPMAWLSQRGRQLSTSEGLLAGVDGLLAMVPGMASVHCRLRLPDGLAGGRAGGEENTMMYWYGSGMSGWGYAVMTVSMVLFWGAVIVGIVALVRYFGHGGQQAPSPPSQPISPEQVLAERFARGEIDEDEYQRRLATLQGVGQAANGRVLGTGTSAR